MPTSPGIDTLGVGLQALPKLIDLASEFLVDYGFQIVGAVIILAVGWYFAAWLGRFVLTLCHRAELDVTLSKFFANVSKAIVLVFVGIIALGKFGITITPLVAAIGAVAFGGTLAFQTQLSNYGAGLNIILLRLFVVGDTITTQGVTGVVEDVHLAYTRLSTGDGELITIPNRHIVGEVLRNSFANHVIEGSVGIDYDSDIASVIGLIASALKDAGRVASSPAPQIGIRHFGESAIEIAYRYWVPMKEYYQTMYEVNGRVFAALRAAGVKIPSARREVRLIQQR